VTRTGTILDRILERTRVDLAERRRVISETVLREQALRTLEGGVSAVNLTAMSPFVGLAESLVELEENVRKIEAMSDVATVVTSVSDIEKAHRDGKLGYVLGTQNSMMVEADLRLEREKAARGLG